MTDPVESVAGAEAGLTESTGHDPGTSERLSFLTVDGDEVEVAVEQAGAWHPVNGLLRARPVTLAPWRGPRELRLLGLAEGLAADERWEGYRRLDNETLAGLRLNRLAARVSPDGLGDGYPRQLSRLVGYQPYDAEGFVLLEPYRGDPIEKYANQLPKEDFLRCLLHLVVGVRWIGAAGVAHRGLSPQTVLWSADGVQITDFSLATLVGTPREVVGHPPWAAPEQRADPRTGGSHGVVSEQDDVWALARLICYVRAGFELTNREQLDQYYLSELLGDAFGPPERRPHPVALLGRLGQLDPLRKVVLGDQALQRGRDAFDALTAGRSGLLPAAPDADPAYPPDPSYPASPSYPPSPSYPAPAAGAPTVDVRDGGDHPAGGVPGRIDLREARTRPGRRWWRKGGADA